MQQTFTKAEVQSFTNAVNLIINKAQWPDLSSKELIDVHASIFTLQATQKIMENHVLELESVTEKPEE